MRLVSFWMYFVFLENLKYKEQHSKMIKKIISFILITCVCCCTVNLSAEVRNSDLSPIKVTGDNANSILSDFGYEEAFIVDLMEEEKINLATAILQNPDNVQVVQTVNHIDEISALEYIVNTTDEELTNQGMDQTELSYIRDNIENLRSMSDEQLKEKYKRNDEQVKLLRMALNENDNYYNKEITGTAVTSSGSITVSEMDFSLTKYDNRSSTCKPVSYRVLIHFNWNVIPLFAMRDEIGLSWGGNLNSMDISREYFDSYDRQFCKTGTETDYRRETTFNKKGALSGLTQTPNTGILFWHEGASLLIEDTRSEINRGYLYVTLYQNQRQNYDTKALTRYGHKVFAPSVSMKLTSLPDIELGWGYDYTDNQPEVTLTY